MIQFHNGTMHLNHDNYENFQPGDGVDTIDGRGGYDEISYTNSPIGMTIDLSQSTITDGWGNVDTIANIEGVEARMKMIPLLVLQVITLLMVDLEITT